MVFPNVLQVNSKNTFRLKYAKLMQTEIRLLIGSSYSTSPKQ